MTYPNKRIDTAYICYLVTLRISSLSRALRK